MAFIGQITSTIVCVSGDIVKRNSVTTFVLRRKIPTDVKRRNSNSEFSVVLTQLGNGGSKG